MLGYSTLETVRVSGYIKNKKLTILINIGSTRYFIQDHLIEFLGLPISLSPNFQVLVRNGEHLTCST